MTDYLEAIEALHDAIDRVNKVSDDQGLLMEWVVVEARHVDLGDGDTGTSMTCFGNPGLPTYRKLGLLHGAMLDTETHFISGRTAVVEE